MNIRKPIDYSVMYVELDEILSKNLPQMEEIYAIGKAICNRSEKGAAVMAAEYLQTNYPDRIGFSPRNVRRMRDFYRTYENDETLLQLAMNIGWTLNVVIMEAALTRTERKWYLEQAEIRKWSKTQLSDAIQEAAYQNELAEERSCPKTHFEPAWKLATHTSKVLHRSMNRSLLGIQGLCYRKLLLC